MAERGRMDARTGDSVTKPVRPRFIPEIGRDYVMLMNKRTGFVQHVHLGEWERISQIDGKTEWSPSKCPTCLQIIIKRSVYADPLSGWAKYIDRCGCCSVGGANDAGGVK